MNILYINNKKTLLAAVGICEDEFWEYLSLDDWDYALVVDDMLSMEDQYDLVRLLVGCCDNRVRIINGKTVGMAYHA